MKRSAVFFMAAALVISGVLVGTAQQKANSTANFSFTMQNESGTMSLACEHGCAWKTLRWSGRGGADVFINDRGMLGGDNKEENSTFLVGIHPGDGKIELSCKRGCAWKALSYGPFSAQGRIDQSGVFTVPTVFTVPLGPKLLGLLGMALVLAASILWAGVRLVRGRIFR